MKLDEDLREFVALLISGEVDFLVVGGHALAFHGYPRYTGDVDFWVRPDPRNAPRILEVFKTFGLLPSG